MTRKPAAVRSRRAALARPAAALLSELRRVRRSPADVEAIHDSRVAARRLMAASELWLPASADREKLHARLEKVVRRLGRVRNLDVALGLLEEGTDADRAARKAIAKRAKRERKGERKKLEGWLKPKRIVRLKTAIAALLHREGSEEADSPVPSALGKRLRRVLNLIGRGNPLNDTARAHEIRREVRFLRYQFETLEDSYPPADFAMLREMFLRLQDAAGAWRDKDILLRLLAWLKREKVPAASVGALGRRVGAERDALGKLFVEALPELVKRKQALVGVMK